MSRYTCRYAEVLKTGIGADMSKEYAGHFFESAEYYDGLIDWQARLKREIPFLTAQFGEPSKAGLLDAGCGSGRQAVAMARRGYRVTGIDPEKAMLNLAHRHAETENVNVRFKPASFQTLTKIVQSQFDGIYCLGNALAATGSEKAARASVRQFARALNPGGRLVLQVINFADIKRQILHGGYTRGPQTAVIQGRTCLSMKVFGLLGAKVSLTRINLYREDDRWQKHISQVPLYPVELTMLIRWLNDAGLCPVAVLGSYAGERFDIRRSGDLIVVAERRRTG